MHNSMTSLIKSRLVFLTWGIMLVGSYLPDILIFELTGPVPDWLLWGKLILFMIFVILSLVYKPYSLLRPSQSCSLYTWLVRNWSARLVLILPASKGCWVTVPLSSSFSRSNSPSWLSSCWLSWFVCWIPHGADVLDVGQF